MNLDIRSARVVRELAEVATFSDAPAPAVTRIVFSDADLRARRWLKHLCADAGLTIREDAVGNTFARWQGTDPDLPAVGTGSHIDAIPNAGQYDGTVGVLGGLEAVRALQSAGLHPRRSIELLLFTSEEPTRFGIGCLGSRLLSGSLDANADEHLVDDGGTKLVQARNHADFHGDLSTVRLALSHYHAFVELHIEQGPILEREGLSIGIVTHIAAPASLRISIEGEGGHAGAVLMHERRDALVAAAELVLAIEAAALETGSSDTVATTGACNVFPGAVNSIPSRVQLGVDIRDVELNGRDLVLVAVEQAAQRIASQRNLKINIQTVNADAPAACDPNIIAAITRSCEKEHLNHRRMVSRAYHDSLFMSRVCPAGMIFIPCRHGVSHRPDEYASPQDITNGIRALAQTLADLAT